MSGLNRRLLLMGAVVAATLALGVSQADACWSCGSYYPVSWGYTAYYTPCYTSCCTASYSPCWSGSCGWYVGYRPGPIRRLLLGPYRWYYGCFDSWSSCCWDTCWGAVGTVAPAAPMQPTPTEAHKPAVPEQPPAQPVEPTVPPSTAPGGTTVPPPPTPGGTTAPPPALPKGPEPGATPPSKSPAVPPAGSAPSTLRTRQNSGLLTIYVPYDAKIAVNGMTTRSLGSRRQYVSYGLKPGFSYKYEIRAEVVQDGKLVQEVRTVTLAAGQHEIVTFGFNLAPSQEVAARW
jgi:uncharacterized protein (TIGR03000 family)